jgi:hypothetical protein
VGDGLADHRFAVESLETLCLQSGDVSDTDHILKAQSQLA